MAKNKMEWEKTAEDKNSDGMKSKSVLSVTDGVTKAAAAFMDFVESKGSQKKDESKQGGFEISEKIKESGVLNLNKDELEINTMIDEAKNFEFEETDKPEDSLWFGSLDGDEPKKAKSKKNKKNKQAPGQGGKNFDTVFVDNLNLASQEYEKTIIKEQTQALEGEGSLNSMDLSFLSQESEANFDFSSIESEAINEDSNLNNGKRLENDNLLVTDDFKVLDENNLFFKTSPESSEKFDEENANEVEDQIENQDHELQFQLSQDETESTELGQFESAQIEDIEFIEDSRLGSIIESVLFASDRPVGLGRFKEIFEGTQITTVKIKMALDQLATELASLNRGVTLEEVTGGWQLRTKVDNQKYLQRSLKNRPFRLSGPALEVLSIVAYKQPIIKSEIDQIRGVESGHLLRALMERGLVQFGGKSELPGRPMFYETTRKFLEVFGLRNLKELPTLSQIDELLPEGIDEVEADRKQGLGQITDSMAQEAGQVYSQGEQELESISQHLEEISTSTEFFEQEKLRQKQIQEAQKAQNLREALLVGETLSTRDKNWLQKYEESLNAIEASSNEGVLIEPPVAEPEGEAREEMNVTSHQIESEDLFDLGEGELSLK